MLLVEENTSTVSTISTKSKFVPKTSAKVVEINDTVKTLANVGTQD